MNEQKKTSLRVLMLIASHKLAVEAAAMFKSAGVPLSYMMHGEGTVSSEMIDILGLAQTEKGVLITALPKPVASTMLSRLYRELQLSRKNSGIALTFKLRGASNIVPLMLEPLCEDENLNRKDDIPMSETKYSMISVVVNQGCTEAVMAAAREAGARGGTVLHSRRISDDKAVANWSLGTQEEKEIVLIVAREEEKTAIMQAISASCGMHSDAKGVVMAMPVESVLGID